MHFCWPTIRSNPDVQLNTNPPTTGRAGDRLWANVNRLRYGLWSIHTRFVAQNRPRGVASLSDVSIDCLCRSLEYSPRRLNFSPSRAKRSRYPVASSMCLSFSRNGITCHGALPWVRLLQKYNDRGPLMIPGLPPWGMGMGRLSRHRTAFKDVRDLRTGPADLARWHDPY